VHSDLHLTTVRRINPGAAILWLAGIALYHGLAQWAPGFGSALPTLAFTFVLAALTRTRPLPTSPATA